MFIVLLPNTVNASNHTKCISLSNQKCKIQPTLSIYILKNTVKNCSTIHLQLNWIDVLEVVIPLMTYLKYVFQMKQKI